MRWTDLALQFKKKKKKKKPTLDLSNQKHTNIVRTRTAQMIYAAQYVCVNTSSRTCIYMIYKI